MADHDRIYFARRAAEEQELALSSEDPEVADAHRKMNASEHFGKIVLRVS